MAKIDKGVYYDSFKPKTTCTCTFFTRTQETPYLPQSTTYELNIKIRSIKCTICRRSWVKYCNRPNFGHFLDFA